MEPITTAIATALALGAAAGLKGTAEQAVSDAYAALKALIQRRYTKVSLAQLEEAPDSKARRAVVEEDLANAGADRDEEVLRQAKELLDLIRARNPEAAGAIDIRLEDIKGDKISNIARGGGVAVVHTGQGDVRIRDDYEIPDHIIRRYVDDMGVSRIALLKFLDDLSRGRAPRENVDAALNKAVQRYVELRGELDSLATGNGNTSALNTTASQALEAGDLSAAELLIGLIRERRASASS